MRVVVVVFVALVAGAGCNVPFSWRCDSGTGKNVTVAPAPINGSYVITYCAPSVHENTLWELRVNTISAPPQYCSYSERNELLRSPSHSVFKAVAPTANCSRVCFSAQMDLMYRSCYRLENTLKSESFDHSVEGYHAYFYADNNFTQQYFCEGSVFFPGVGPELELSSPARLELYQGRVPLYDYTITVTNNNSSDSEAPLDVTGNCTSRAEAAGLTCELRLAPGCHTLRLEHRAPWTAHAYYAAHCAIVHWDFCIAPTPVPAASGVSPIRIALGACAALAVLCAGVAAALWARRARGLDKEFILKHWLNSTRARGATSARGAEGGGGERLLLLYARDCAPAHDVLTHLKAALEIALPGQVVDLYSCECVAAGAGAAGQWLRGALHSPAARILLLQTPALACLHRNQPAASDQDPLALSEPLLPTQVVYREPHPADGLLQYALRLLADCPNAPHPYRKYYLATLSALPVDTLPSVVPYARYALPGAALALLAALNPALDETPELHKEIAALAAAADRLAEYVHANANYLADELMFL